MPPKNSELESDKPKEKIFKRKINSNNNNNFDKVNNLIQNVSNTVFYTFIF